LIFDFGEKMNGCPVNNKMKKECDFYEDKEESLTDILSKEFFKRLKTKNDFSELNDYVRNDSYEYATPLRNKLLLKFDKKLEKTITQILVNQGLIEYETLMDGTYNSAEDVAYPELLAYILLENVLSEEEVEKINFNNLNPKQFVGSYLIYDLENEVLDFIIHPADHYASRYFPKKN